MASYILPVIYAAFVWWFSTGAVLHATGERNLGHLGGLIHRMPWVAWLIPLALALATADTIGAIVPAALSSEAPLPSDTTSFARALGLPQRSSLSAGSVPSLRLAGAATAFFEQPWRECADTLPNAPDVLAWHDWPDSLMHDLSGAGPGLRQLAEDARKVLVGDDFWHFVDRMATGRRLVITSDHGYAASGLFAAPQAPAPKPAAPPPPTPRAPCD